MAERRSHPTGHQGNNWAKTEGLANLHGGIMKAFIPMAREKTKDGSSKKVF